MVFSLFKKYVKKSIAMKEEYKLKKIKKKEMKLKIYFI